MDVAYCKNAYLEMHVNLSAFENDVTFCSFMQLTEHAAVWANLWIVQMESRVTNCHCGDNPLQFVFPLL